MKRIIILVALVAAFAAACGGTNGTANQTEANQVNIQQAQYENVQPIPYFDYSLQRQALIDIYKAQNLATQTWSVVTSYSGQFLFECESEGWPIPANYQLTNPQVLNSIYGSGSSYGVGTVGQAEPNGIYSGNTQGTYVLCIRPDGKISPIYTENNVQMFPFAVKVNPTTGAIEDAGAASNITIDVKGGNAGSPPPPASPKP